RHSAALIVPDHQTINDHLDEMFATVIDAGRFGDVVRTAIDAHTHEAGAADFLPQRLVLLLAAPLDRCGQVQFRALGTLHDLLDDLVSSLRADRQAARGAVRLTESSEQDSQVVVDFRYGADGRARTLAGGLLLDADGWRQAADVLDLRFLHLAEK